jgi:hypothetical protein
MLTALSEHAEFGMPTQSRGHGTQLSVQAVVCTAQIPAERPQAHVAFRFMKNGSYPVVKLRYACVHYASAGPMQYLSHATNCVVVCKGQALRHRGDEVIWNESGFAYPQRDERG